MKKSLLLPSVLLVACTNNAPKPPVTPVPAEPAAAESPAPTQATLSELEAVTFACPKAALNAAAREVKKAPSQGSYQFSYFRIASNSHHAQYEVHFKSNVLEEPELKYCVSVYCQQGWDPKTSKTEVQLMGNTTHAMGAAHGSGCGEPVAARVKRRAKH